MTPEIEAALKGHPDTITAHGILAREITDLRARLAASEAEVARIKADAQQRYGEALGERDEEKRKREEAERALQARYIEGRRDAFHDFAEGSRNLCDGCYDEARRCEKLEKNALLPAPEKKSQEKS